MSLREGAEEEDDFSGVQPSQNGVAPTLLDATTTLPCRLPLYLPTTPLKMSFWGEFSFFNSNELLVGEENDSKEVDRENDDEEDDAVGAKE